MGLVTAAPNDYGQPHHHGEAETAAYVISGRVRVYYGENFEEVVEAGPGDFLFVPPHTPHIEANPFDEPHTAVLVPRSRQHRHQPGRVSGKSGGARVQPAPPGLVRPSAHSGNRSSLEGGEP